MRYWRWLNTVYHDAKTNFHIKKDFRSIIHIKAVNWGEWAKSGQLVSSALLLLLYLVATAGFSQTLKYAAHRAWQGLTLPDRDFANTEVCNQSSSWDPLTRECGGRL